MTTVKRSPTRGLTGYKNDNNTSDDGADPAIVALDAKYKQTVTQEELATFENRDFDRTTNKIKVPSFLINGTDELFFCGSSQITAKNGRPSAPITIPGYYCGSNQALTQFEGQFFSPEACITAAVVPYTGHMLNLHKSAPIEFAIAKYFADSAVGPNGQNAGGNCSPPPTSGGKHHHKGKKHHRNGRR